MSAFMIEIIDIRTKIPNMESTFYKHKNSNNILYMPYDDSMGIIFYDGDDVAFGHFGLDEMYEWEPISEENIDIHIAIRVKN